ncbi:Monocarboxylate transporter [Wickerhamomyces ciferrii]|uniref:Monocarboxylate transporter n=1 Tax=Wickerhamomyces ciferrii (strain ATCC 14091 / BCRC 22168 / CBS 111 / JCM 3599 / NBRC 0793 / NRRL Y-1031 F-60-10) TaxID=1206466 RepID=K0KXP8_WICCF|nr:Monocarboxylate transporter [Wickerhamomyces ciferrii]CCH46239.1 Monocarboxylate transporter [Wickerhamomyces ciferrii]
MSRMESIKEATYIVSEQGRTRPESIELDFIPELGTSSALGHSTIRKDQDFTEQAIEKAQNEDGDDVSILDDDLTFPDGGLEAYLVVLGALLSLIITFGLMNSIGGIQAYISNHQLSNIENQSSTGWIFSIYYFFAFGGVILTGPLFDYKGAKIPMISGSLLISIGLFATANCSQIYQFILAFGVTVGIGTSFLMSSALGAVAHWFGKKRGTALGVCSIGGSLGGVLWPLMLKELYPKIGYAWTMRVLAFLGTFCLGMACLLVKHRLIKPSNEVIKSPRQLFQNSFVLKQFITEKRFLYMGISIFLCEVSLLFVTTYLSSYTIHQGYSESDAFLVLITCNAVGILGRYFPNHIADHFGRINVMVITVGVCSLLIMVLLYPFGNNLKTIYAFSGLYGFFSSSTLSLTPVCCGQISKTKDFGKRYGTIYSLVSIGNLISLPVGGAIISSSGDGYKNLILLAGITEILALLAWLITRYYCVGMKVMCKV